ncbi:MAG: insulinase family protein [Acidobacteria bacterium]|nr:insulinase family protein [Acidobacteriota bacterium]
MRHRTPIALLLAFLVAAPAARVSAQQPPDRSAPPPAGPAPALALPAIQKRQLSNGLPVWIVELHEVPVAQVNLVTLSGSAEDPAGKFGLASLTSAMLMEGAGSRSSLEIADAIDYLGADLSTASTSDMSVVRLHVPVARLADALPIMADVALRPTFPAEELERQRQQRLTSLLQARDDPGTIAALAFSRVLYGASHRYGTAQMGTAATLNGFTVDDLKTFYASEYRPANTVLIVVGDTTPEKAMPLLESGFGGWKAPAAAPAPDVALPEAPEPARRHVYLVDKPGAAQSQIRIGWIGAPRSTPDYFPLQVMNTILGGAFSSRLNMNLREEHGYTYGASSQFDMRASAGPFAAGAGVQTDKTTESLQEFFKELNGILAPVPADELARAKNYVALRFPSSFETTGDISRRLEELDVYGLPENYFASYVQNIQAVSAADVQRVARRYIQPGRFAVVVVGDLKTIEAGVRSLGLGEVTVLTLDQVMGPPPAN